MTLSKIEPNEFYDQENGGSIPIFTPTMEQFKDFKLFMESIEEYGRKSGVVKIIPPKEWTMNLPKLSNLEDIKISKPITQHIIGARGIFTQTNIESRKEYTLDQWHELCHQANHRPPIINKETTTNDITGQEYSTSHLSVDQYKNIERHYWRNITFNQPMYGADLQGTLFGQSVSLWNINTLDNTLNRLGVTVPGVNSPYLYFGMWKATFPWHVEDMDLYSINYIHFGAPKQWYVIQPCYQKRFEDFMKATFYIQYKECHEFMRHKTFIVSPKVLENNNIPVSRCVQQPGEFMVTFPFGYHAGYNLDFNCAESVNFALDSWIEIGKKAKACTCIEDAVVIDVDSLLEESNIYDKVQKKKRQAAAEEKNDNHTIKTKKQKIDKKTGDIKTKEEKNTLCVLCPLELSNVQTLDSDCGNYKGVHKVCAEAVDETFIKNNHVYGINTVPASRWKLTCIFCKEKTGACMQCCYGKCWKAFHATCAISNGATMNKLINPANQPISLYDGYCPKHDPKQVSKREVEKKKNQKEMTNKYKVGADVYTKWRGGGPNMYHGMITESIPSQKMCRVLLKFDGIARKIHWRDIDLHYSPPSL